MSKELAKAARAWAALEHVVPVGTIRSEAQYRRVSKFLDRLLDEGGASESHPLAGLVDVLANAVREYELHDDPLPDVRGSDVLAFLMATHQLTQSDFPEIGAQSVVSEILRGERILNARMIGRLAARFKLPTDVFYGPEQLVPRKRKARQGTRVALGK